MHVRNQAQEGITREGKGKRARERGGKGEKNMLTGHVTSREIAQRAEDGEIKKGSLGIIQVLACWLPRAGAEN